MPLTSLSTPVFWPGHYTNTGAAPALTTDNTLDAAGEYVAYVFCAREAMVISHVGWRTGVVAGSPTVDTRIEDVDPTTGFPTGNLWGTTTNIISGTLTSTTWTLHALTLPATIAAGQIFAIKIVYASGTSTIIQRATGLNTGIYALPYTVTNTSGAAAKALQGGVPLVALGSSSTVFYRQFGALPVTAFTNTAFNNTNGARRGVRFQVPVPCRLVGVRTWVSTSVGDFNIAAFDDAGTELSSSSTAYIGPNKVASAAGVEVMYFDNPVTLAANTWYRVAVEPSTTTNVNFMDFTSPSAAYLTGMPGGASYNLTSYASSAWDDTATTRSPMLDLMFDQFSDGRAPRAHSMIGM